MILTIDLTGKTFIVTRATIAKLDNQGVPRVEKHTGNSVWTTEVCCTDVDGGTIMNITTSSADMPKTQVGDDVIVRDLIAIPWNNGKGVNGIAWRAASIELDE